MIVNEKLGDVSMAKKKVSFIVPFTYLFFDKVVEANFGSIPPFFDCKHTAQQRSEYDLVTAESQLVFFFSSQT